MANDPVITIRKNFSRPDPELVKQFVGLPTGYVVDIQGRRGAMDCGIKPMIDASPFAGTAVTVKTVPDDNLAPYAALDVLQPGDVLVIAIGEWTGSAVIGDLICGMFRNAGVAGVVTDGAVRDVAGLIDVGMPVYARGLTANSPQKNGPGAIGYEVSIGGVVVRSGDLVVGDRDGVVVLPREKISTALEAVEAVREKEGKLEASISDGLVQPDWIKKFLASDRVKYDN
jgi:4-hydroxy-4-methyl-2-oxoglutarate aldolase